VYIANHLSNEDHFDELFHIYLVIKTDLGFILIEKTERINITNRISFFRDSERFEIPSEDIPEDLTFGEFVENAQKYMGVKQFFSYEISSNNCQNFICGLLAGSGVKSGNTFCLQHVSSIFANHPESRKILNSIIGSKTLIDRFEDETIYHNNPMRKK
jgi:hypothetical protein